MHTTISSPGKTLVIGDDQPFAIIGERINPTGRKIFQQQLRNGDLTRIVIDVEQQVTGGAMALDVNMGAPLADEADLMVQAVTLIQQLTDLPLVIDSSIPEVLEAGLKAYQGKALVNSVTAEDDRLQAILPVVARYGAAIIGLPNDEEQIPEEPEARLELTRKLIRTATDTYKIPIEDIVIDPLAMPVGADTLHPGRTLETIALIKDEFGVNMTLGASNVSFGMPDRDAITAAFLPLAASARADQRDHGRPVAGGGDCREGRRPAARPGRLGRGVDRLLPRPPVMTAAYPRGRPCFPRGTTPCRPPGKGGRPPFTPFPGERAQPARPRASRLPGWGRPPCRPPGSGGTPPDTPLPGERAQTARPRVLPPTGLGTTCRSGSTCGSMTGRCACRAG